MTGASKVAFEVKPVITECGLSLPAGLSNSVIKTGAVPDHSHSASTATGDGLNHDGGGRIQCLNELGGLGGGGKCSGSRYEGHVAAVREFPGQGFITEYLKDFGAWADKDQSALFTLAGELGVFREEAVTRMDGIAAGIQGDTNNAVDIPVSGGAGAVEHGGIIGGETMA